MNVSGIRRIRVTYAVPAIIAFAALMYVPSLSGGFFNDDFFYVVNNDLLQSVPLSEAWKIFLTRSGPYEFYPVRDLSFRLDMALFGLAAWGYHLHNMVLYVLTCLVVWRGTRQMVLFFGGSAGRDTELLAAAVTAFFALHPAHVESVAWISGRKELLSGLFTFLCMWQFFRSHNEGLGFWRGLVPSYLFFAAALLSKATVTPLPVVLLVAVAGTTRVARGAARWRAAAGLLPLIALTLASMALATSVGASTAVKLISWQYELFAQQSILERTELSTTLIGFFTRIAFAPFGLRLMYSVEGAVTELVLGMAAAGVVAVAVYWCVRRRSLPAFGLVFFALFLLPFLQIIPFTTMSKVAERYLFIPVFGAGLFLCALLVRGGRRSALAVPVVLVVFSALTFARGWEWRDPESLYFSNARYEPANFEVALRVLGTNLLPTGQFGVAREHAGQVENERGRALLELYVDAYEALETGPLEEITRVRAALEPKTNRYDDPGLLRLLGQLHEREGNYFEAARYYFYAIQRVGGIHSQFAEDLRRVARQFDPAMADLKRRVGADLSDVGARMELANLLTSLYRLDEARGEYEHLLALVSHPAQEASLRYNLGIVAMRQRDYERSAAEFLRAEAGGIRTSSLYNNLGTAYRELYRNAEAERFFLRAMAVDPFASDPAYNLGLLREIFGDRPGALEAFAEGRRRALLQGRPTDPFDAAIHQLSAVPE